VGNVSQIANVEGRRLIKKKQKKRIENVNFSIALSLSKHTLNSEFGSVGYG